MKKIKIDEDKLSKQCQFHFRFTPQLNNKIRGLFSSLQLS